MSTRINTTCDETGRLVGISEKDEKALARWRNACAELEPGEGVSFSVDIPVNKRLHGWHFVLMTAVFKAQERFTDDDAMRAFIYVAAGYCKWQRLGRKRVAIPDSWAFTSLPNDIERGEMHEKCVIAMHDQDVLRELWPHLKPAARLHMIMDVIAKTEAERERKRAEWKARMQLRARAIANKPVEQVAQIEMEGATA